MRFSLNAGLLELITALSWDQAIKQLTEGKVAFSS